MKFRTLVAIAAAAAASAVAWKMVKDARREDDDITLELAGDAVREAQEDEVNRQDAAPNEQDAGEEADGEDRAAQEAEEAAPAQEPAAPQRPIDPTAIASAEDFSGDWEDIGCKS